MRYVGSIYNWDSRAWTNMIPGPRWIIAWISYDIGYKMRDEISYSFPNINGEAVDVWEWITVFDTDLMGVRAITYRCRD